MPDLNSRSSTKPVEGGFHARDLRLAGGISAALVSAILVGGALLAPVADWDGLSPSAGGGSDKTKPVRLASVPRPQTPEREEPRPDPSGPVLTVPGVDGPVALDPAGLTGGTPVSLQVGGGDPEPERGDEPQPIASSTASDGSAIDDPAANDLGIDSDGDGILDQAWRAYGMDPHTNPLGDDDGDGILNRDELELRTTPNNATTNGQHDSEQLEVDSDGDGLRNGVEIKNGSEPFVPDSDGDGVVDGDTNGDHVVDDNDDFDGDGHSNGAEAAAGTDPDDPASFPVPPTEEPDDTPPPPTDPVDDNPARTPEEDDTSDDEVEPPTPDDEPEAEPTQSGIAEPVEAAAEPAPATAAPAPVEAAPAPAPPSAAEAPAAAAAPAPEPAAAPAEKPAPAPAQAVAPPPPPPPPPAPAAAAATPATPAAPATPATPATPAAPATPATPATPAAPATK
jgi:hypothetical protein